jgi:hypothetical protein
VYVQRGSTIMASSSVIEKRQPEFFFFFPAVNVDSNESTSGYSISARQPKATKVWQVPSHFSALLNISL